MSLGEYDFSLKVGGLALCDDVGTTSDCATAADVCVADTGEDDKLLGDFDCKADDCTADTDEGDKLLADGGERPLVVDFDCEAEGGELPLGDLDLAYSLYGSSVFKCNKLDIRGIGTGSFAALNFSITAWIASYGDNGAVIFSVVSPGFIPLGGDLPFTYVRF